MSHKQHKKYLDMAARAAWRAVGDVEPNPLVGAVLVRDGRVLAIGHHKKFGGLHAEREALKRCRELGEDPRGATLYCTLEPCRHTGKQPPCTEAVIEAGIARVVAARLDPGPESGGGHAILEAAGIPCEVSNASANAIRISDPFVYRVKTGRPWVIAKWAQTLDGKLDVRDEGRRWISGELARRRVHQLRSRVDAIVTGIGTVFADDPLLTVRGVRRPRRKPERVVLDTRFRLPVDSAMAKTARDVAVLDVGSMDEAVTHGREDAMASLEDAGVLVMGSRKSGRPILREIFGELRSQREVSTLILESGPTLIRAAFEQELVNEAVVHVPGGVLSKAAHAAQAFQPDLAGSDFQLVRAARVGDDVELGYRRMGVC